MARMAEILDDTSNLYDAMHHEGGGLDGRK